MSGWAWRHSLVVGAVCAALTGQAQAQSVAGSSIGAGPRVTFVRAEAGSADAATRFTGGVLRIGSGYTALELAVDYRSVLGDDQRTRVRSIPFQASVLLYPVRAVLAPYLLGGAGWYGHRIESLDDSRAVIATATTKRVGAHAGLGAEVRLHRRISVYGDYRYTFIRLGRPRDDEASPADGGVTEIPLLEKLRPSHEGSMWTWGAVVRF